ncbi:hypothetical protein J2Z19_001817 [Ensifer adhaerens]|uniref:Uncharacterized protein n=1 Tax=Ensifer adhaerens TaxID=106592 RepID=A0ACC5STH7_ENSAD|nr:hypothetical protein [Ensifer adhaerens]
MPDEAEPRRALAITPVNVDALRHINAVDREMPAVFG